MTLFDPGDARFFDEADTDKELKRVFQICHGCRLCFSFCPSFPELFDRIDAHIEKGEGEAEALTKPEIDRVIDLCFQCKLCFVKCPYTPPHEWDVDFPRLAIRAKAVRAHDQGVSAQDRALGNPDRLGRIGTALPSLVNWANDNSVVRGLMEKTLGIHRERNLPRYQSPSFADWHARNARPPRKDAPPGETVVLYGTCAVNYNEPDVGVAAVQVLERNGKRTVCAYDQCCGMPSLDSGDVQRAVAAAEANVRTLLPLARAGLPILVPQPSCGYMIKQEYPRLVPGDDAKLVSAATVDLCEYLQKLHRARALDTSFTVPQGRIAYHAPCHLRAQNVGLPAADLLELIPRTEVERIEKCSAFDGTWGMKKAYFPLSLKYAGKLNRAIEDAEARLIASDCRLAGLNVEKGLGRTPLHPVQILRDAYGIAPDPVYPAAAAAGARETKGGEHQ